MPGLVLAETPEVHYLHSGVAAPGAIGTWQLQRGGPLYGYFQPVEIRAPEGVRISLAVDGGFDDPQPVPRLAGLQIAPVYRLRVTQIPLYEGEELFPTIEVIDRLYPPCPQATRFPIPIEFTQADLEAALEGKFVTRVIYLEDPELALPRRQEGQQTLWFDAGPGNNPLKMADELGRPVAILRMGGRTPDPNSLADRAFYYGFPPLVNYVASQMFEEQIIEGELDEAAADEGSIVRPVAHVEPVQGEVHEDAELAHGAFQGEAAVGVEEAPQCDPRDSGMMFGPPGAVPPAPIPQEILTPFAERVPCPAAESEYLRDGGDQQPEAMVDPQWNVFGLEQEDTIIHYDTLDGSTQVCASNRVRIYAPRFAAVRLVVNPHASDQVAGPRGFDGKTPPLRLTEANGAHSHLQNIEPRGQFGRKRASGYRMSMREGAISTALVPLGFHNEYAAYESLGIIRLGRYDQSEKARLANSIDAAIVWSQDQVVEALVNQDRASEVVGDQRAQVTFRFDELGCAAVRIVKVASVHEAQPGDTIDFTLRFDNVGTEPVGNVTLLDNLATRLEYVDGSAQSSVEADFSARPNPAGSVVLRWEIREALLPGRGGVVRFQAVVR